MRIPTITPRRPADHAARRRAPRPAAARPPVAAAPRRPQRLEDRIRDAGGPQDVTVATCSCGLVFETPVTTSQTCPHCGTDQAW
jgi:hypothetical protein